MFPAIILPAFVGAALLLASLLVLLRGRNPKAVKLKQRRYRDIVVAVCIVAAFCCAGLAVILVVRGTPDSQEEIARSAPSIEADMLVSRGTFVDLYLNDWQHPPERIPLIAGERHIYRFTKIPQNLTQVRLDPTELADARIVIYGLTVKAGSQTIRQFGPAELKNWQRQNVTAPTEDNGGLVMLDTNDDPLLFNPVAIRIPERKPPSLMQLYYRPLALGLAALLLVGLVRMATGTGRLAALLDHPCPELSALPARYRNLPVSSWAAGLVVLLVAGGTVYFQKQAADSDIGLEVDMLVSRGNSVDLYVNDWEHPPEQVPVVVGQRHVYRFTRLPSEITLLRLDPTDVANAQAVIYSMVVKNRTQTFQQLGPAELKTWQMQNISPKEENGGLVLTDTNNDPIMYNPLAWRLPGGKLQMLSPLIKTPDSTFLLAITVFLLVLLVRMSTRTGRMQAVLIAVAGCVAFPIVFLIMKLSLLPPPPVRSSVGLASYTGYPKANEYVSAFALMLICICLGYAFARFAGPGEDELEEAAVASRRPYAWIAYTAVFGVVFLYYLPNLLGVLTSMGGAVYSNQGWDYSISVHWQEMVNAGLRPLRDFWFPYSGSYIQFLPAPTGVIVTAFHHSVVLWVLFLALFKATGRRLAHALVIFSLILAPILLGMLPSWQRYLLSIDVALLYIGMRDATRLDWKRHVPFALFVGYVFFFEPTQIIYAGMGIAVDTILAALSRFQNRAGENGPGGRPSTLRERLMEGAQVLKQRLVYVGAPMLSGITGSLLIFAANGMLPGLWDFEKSIGDQGDYGAFPSEIVKWVRPFLQPDTVFLLMFLLASYAVYRWIRLKGRQDDSLGAALIVLSCTTFVAMQKQILRPHGMTQLRLFPYVALLIFGLIVWRERNPAVRMVIAAFLGCILGIAVHRNLLRMVYHEDIEAGPGKVSGSIDALLHHRQDFDRVNATLFSRSRFAGFDQQNAVVDNLIQACGLRAEDTVYVLGDDSILYIMLNQRPPYVSNSYNDSPLSEQQRVLDWFHRKTPRFVIWGTDVMAYDNVPHIVRLPLIFTYVVEHYEFLRAVGPYHILVERPPDHPPDLAYWRRVLGDRVDLGHVPGLARLSEYAPCSGDTAHCDAVLVVKYPRSRPAPGSKLTVDIESPGGPLRVQFDVSPEEREYVVNLNRLWFWNPLSRPAPPRITAEDAAAEVVMDYRRERSPVLY